jgi:membrane-bound lytic murein transglycosylase D
LPRPACVISVLGFAFLAFPGCSGRSGGGATAQVDPPPPPAAADSPEPVENDSIQKARLELEKGESLAREGRWEEARLAFDRAVDLLLAMPGGVGSDEEARSFYEDVLATIREAEREHKNRLAEDAEATEVPEPLENAAVDELTEDVSLMESTSEVAFDPNAPAAELDIPEATYDIPVETNARVLAIIEMFQTQKREWFQEALDRSARYMPLFERVLEEEGAPRDLVYLAMIESAFKPRAASRAGARGIWQFISGTGRLYGLRQDFWVDDRFDVEKATRAAARHLLDLHAEFNDWYLAMAAYNAGAKRIDRAIRRGGNRDFWTLAQKRYLPRETRSYVPLILAAAVIAKNPETYGFVPAADSALEFDVVELDEPVDLETAAKAAGVPVGELQLLNPELRHWVTPLDRASYPLKVPRGGKAAFAEALASIPPGERVRFGAHVVERGDTLSKIARRYGTSVEALRSANRLGARSLIHPGQVLTIPVPPGALAAKASRSRLARAERRAVFDGNQEIYVVARGDTLGAIARSFGLSLEELLGLNDLPDGSIRIQPGQRILVSGARPRTPPPPPVRSSEGYTVRPGDTLGGIADAHGISLAELRRLNGMSPRASRIYAGEVLVVTGPSELAAAPAERTSSSASATSYRVRRGDTLSHIARRFGVSVDDLRRWNGLTSDQIAAGDSLTVHAAGGTQ